MARLSDRLSQNPVKQQLSSDKQQRKAQASLMAVGAGSSEKLRSKNNKVDSPNNHHDQEDDDKEFEDCD